MAHARAGAIPANAFAARLLALAAILTLAVLAQLRGGESLYSGRVLGALYALVLAGFLLALAYGALAAWSPFRQLHLVELIGDAVVISGFVYCSGGARSIFGFLYPIWIVYAALALGSRGAMIACSFATVALGAIGRCSRGASRPRCRRAGTSCSTSASCTAASSTTSRQACSR